MGALDVIIKVILAAGGLAGLGALFMVNAQKNKLVADTGKTHAEADNVVAEAQQRRTAREISLIEPYERMHDRMQRELSEAYQEIDRLKLWVRSLMDACRAAGIEVPDEPPRIEHATD